MASASDNRTGNFQLRVNEDELRMLRAIAEADGLTASDVIRQFIRREFAARWPSKTKKR